MQKLNVGLEGDSLRLGTRPIIEPWLSSFGFRFDPFQHLEASSDPRLGEYIVGHETFAVAWGEAPALVFAPAGGGKTAMRLYTTRSCWVGLGRFQPFPIPYLLPENSHNGQPLTLNEHLQRLLRAGAKALLIGLVFRPERFLGLDALSRKSLTAIFHASLLGPLPHYLDILRETGNALDLLPHLDRTYSVSNPPPREIVLDLCAAFEAAAPEEPARLPPPEKLFDHLVELLLGPLGFRSIFLLVDGVDALPETIVSPAVAADWVASLFKHTSTWEEQRIFLKGFLPLEVEIPLNERLPDLLPSVRRARLEWTPALLAEVIRRRLYVASEGEFGSLDAISSLALRDSETVLAKAIRPLPREMLVLVRRVLREYAQRTGGSAGRLEPEDLEAALNWYQTHPVAAEGVPFSFLKN